MTFDREEHTRPGLNRPPLRSVHEVESDDPQVLLGQLMRNVSRLQTQVDDLKTLPSEVRALRDEIREDRGALVKGASIHAARRAGNRLAVLMGSLFTLYELTAPTLRAAWKALH